MLPPLSSFSLFFFCAWQRSALFARGSAAAQRSEIGLRRSGDSKASFVGKLTVRVIQLTATGRGCGRVKTICGGRTEVMNLSRDCSTNGEGKKDGPAEIFALAVNKIYHAIQNTEGHLGVALLHCALIHSCSSRRVQQRR